ncbi:MAG: hypothetical protein M9924_16890 [Rhizobiaceae bacterium]|nr:hypothetical protein [Rhizobiaceae bacterium]
MRSQAGRFVLTILAIGVTAPSAVASGSPIECYQHIYRKPLYGTVTERVELYPAYTDVQTSAAIVGTRERVTQITPESEGVRVIPAQYRTIRERVLLEPAKVVRRQLPPRTEIRYRKELVPGGYKWEWRVINGRRVLCKIAVPSTYRKVAERVPVGPARTVNQTIPAVYGYREKVIEVAPERHERYVIPARFASETEQVVLRPKIVRERPVAPAYRTVGRKVLLRPGEDAYKRIAIPDRCKM